MGSVRQEVGRAEKNTKRQRRAAEAAGRSETNDPVTVVASAAVPNADDDRVPRKSIEAERAKLPIAKARGQLMEEMGKHRAVVLVGETGSGKTTQIPQFLLESGLAEGGAIACTQPRRVAAIAVARRVAQEMGAEVGGLVGYSVRFEDKTSGDTRIKYLTDGMLLREVLRDPRLGRYKVVIVDEAHERTVATDVLFGLLKGVMAERPSDFRLIIMSATLDAAAFLQYFKGARAIYVQGRQFPVQLMYTPQPEDDYLDAALTAVMQIHFDERPGDVLVFLTGQEEIESMERLLAARREGIAEGGGTTLLVAPIYAAMPREQQMRVFEPTPEGARKVVLATNIAETSLTIPGIRYVVDTGFVKARNYSAKLGADSLQVVPISQAQARQRSGRAGREGPGVAFRLYTEGAFEGLEQTSRPEIQRINLASVVMQLKALGVEDVVGFDFMDRPPTASLLRALELLYALGAVGPDGHLSHPLGAHMARLPVDPMFSKVLLLSGEMGCCEEALGVVSMVSAENVFFTPRGKAEEAAEARKRFACPFGDHTMMLQVFQAWMEVPARERGRWCRDHFINSRALSKAADIYNQLKGYLSALEIPLTSCGEDTTSLRRCLVSGLFPHAARRQPDGTYSLFATSQVVHLHPSSVLCASKPPCVVFNELVRTTKQYARCAAVVEPAWLVEMAPQFFASKADISSTLGPGGAG